jgi:dTDP-4-amino-4,6-dideoxygalactose transaminase
MERRVEARWSSDADALVCLSVRSGLDLLLATLAYPKGSEILVSAITIRDMVRIVEQHGLLPVPVDLDMQTLNVRMESLKRARSPRTKAVLVAHLFGSRMDLEEVGVFAREHGLLLIEDCAQSFTGLQHRGHAASDVTMFSFGPIKTSTALGGAILGIRDRSLLARMRAIKSHHPRQTRWHFFRRVCRFALVKLLLCRVPFTLFCSVCRLLNKSHDEVISHSVRGFSGPDLFSNVRRQPGYPLLALLRRRLDRFHGQRIARRMAAARTVLRSAPTLPRPGGEAAHHSYWTFPVQSLTPDALVGHLWRRGFDATRGAWSLHAVSAPAQCALLKAPKAQEAMSQVVYLPVHPEVSDEELQRLTRAVLEFEEDGTRTPNFTVISNAGEGTSGGAPAHGSAPPVV